MPSLHLKYMIGYAHTFGVSYSRRINRPWYSQFNPHITIAESAMIYAGNPDLLPSYYNSYNADYMLYTPNTTISTALNFNSTDNSSAQYHTITE
jgi:hypothetical protein